MAKLPLKSVYINGFPDRARATSGKLPNGDVINATKSYTKLLSFFTSGVISPEELRQMGNKKLKDLLEQVRETHMGAWLWPRTGFVLGCPGSSNPRPLLYIANQLPTNCQLRFLILLLYLNYCGRQEKPAIVISRLKFCMHHMYVACEERRVWRHVTMVAKMFGSQR